MSKGRQNESERAKKTLYITGFNPKFTTKPLLTELFSQGGPVADVTLFETHAYILFQHEESIPYCLALFSDIELHGNRLKISPRTRTKNTYCFVDYLTKVRNKIRDEYLNIQPPDLPSKMTNQSRAMRSKKIKSKKKPLNKRKKNKNKNFR